ncbi:MAG: hypothetical protein JWN18_192 [Parcubacteria group bacterium]|nr:hypothetical protein [Parcubacteria group bacterium]
MSTFKQKSLFAALAGLGVLGIVDSAQAVHVTNAGQIDRPAVSANLNPIETAQTKQIYGKGTATSGGASVMNAKAGAGSSGGAPVLWHAFSHGDAMPQIGFQST